MMKRIALAKALQTPERTAIWALLVIGLAVFLNSLAGSFVFDDTAFLNSDYLDIRSGSWLVSPAESPMKGRPLAGLTFVVNYALCGERPVGYHLFNMLVHLACSVALFGVVRRTLMSWASGSPGVPGVECNEPPACSVLGARYARPEAPKEPAPGRSDAYYNSSLATTGVAFAVALLWMVHPLQTECVNYISQRTESMAGLFILLSLYCAIRAMHAEQPSRWTLLAGVASWLGVMSKEVAAVGPVLIVLHDLTFAGSSAKATIRQRWPLYVAVFSSWIPLAALMCLLPRTATVGANADVSMLQYGLNQSVLIVEYLRLACWPDTLLIDYGKPWDVSLLEAFPCLVAVAGLLALTLAVYPRLPAAGYLGAWVFLLLAPTSSFVPINTEVGAERRMYLPLAAIIVLAVLGVRALAVRCCVWVEGWRRLGTTHRSSLSVRSGWSRVIEPAEQTRWGLAVVDPRHQPDQKTSGTRTSNVIWQAVVLQGVLLGFAATALSARTIDRNSDYANPLKLWTQAVEELPRNRRAWVNLAGEFRRVAPKTAALVSEEIIRRWPAEAPTYYEVAMYHRYEGNFDKAIQYFRRVAELDPDCLEAQRRLVWLLAACEDDAVRDGKAALRIARELCEQRPDSAEMRDALALAQAECGDFSEACQSLQDAIARAREEGSETLALEQRLEVFGQELPFRFGVR